MRTIPELFNESSPFENILKQRDFIHRNIDKEEWNKKEIKHMLRKEIDGIRGLKALSYIFVVMLLANYVQMDLIKRNRWKDTEVIDTNKAIWVFSSSLYLYIDFILFFIAFIQTNKLLTFFYKRKAQDQKKSPEIMVEELNTQTLFSSSTSLEKDIQIEVEKER